MSAPVSISTTFRDDDPVWDVVALRYATRSTSKSECYLDYEAHGEPDAALGMDYFFYVLRSGERTVLVDVGFDPAVGERRGRTCLCPPVDALAHLGVAPDAVSQIIVTHLHYDHIGNLAAFPGAELVVHERELAFWCGPLASSPEFAVHVEADEIGYLARSSEEGRARVLSGSGSAAPGIEAVCVGGHSPGQLVLLVNGRSGPVLLASDAVHYYEELGRGWPFAIFVDLEGMVAGYDVVRRLVDECNAALVVGHDPLVCERFAALEGELSGFGVQLS